MATKRKKKQKNSKRMVVDASVARAAGGEEATFPQSSHCREVLVSILDICHKVVVTQALWEEWNRHQSRFATLWRGQMVRKQKWLMLPIEENTALRAKVTPQIAAQARARALQVHPTTAIRTKLDSVDDAREAMLKDFHLLEAAMQTDRIVISLDKLSQTLFAVTCQHVGEIGDVMWVHPDDADILEWLGKGADSDPEKQLRRS